MRTKMRLMGLMGIMGLMLAGTVQGQTNASVGGDLQDALNKLLASTNMLWETHATYASGLTRKWGGGFGGYYLITQSGGATIGLDTYAGVRVDWVDGDFWMPDGNVGLQMPIHPVSSWTNFVVTPFTYTGIGVPISGASVGGFTLGSTPRDNNGQMTAILGAGLALDIINWGSGKWNLGVLADDEKWTGFSGNQYRAGLWLRKKGSVNGPL